MESRECDGWIEREGVVLEVVDYLTTQDFLVLAIAMIEDGGWYRCETQAVDELKETKHKKGRYLI